MQEVHHEEKCGDGDVDVDDHEDGVGLQEVAVQDGERDLDVDHDAVSGEESSEDELEEGEAVEVLELGELNVYEVGFLSENV